MTTQDLSTYTEVDASNRISRTSTTETVSNLGTAETAYSYKDFGASYFAGSYYAEGTLNTGSFGTPATIFFGFGSAVSTWGSDSDVAGLLLQNSSGYTPYCDLKTGGTETDGVGTNLTAATNYYYRIGVLSALGQYGTLVLWIYSDSGRTTLVSSAVNPKTTSAAYRYFYPVRSLGSGSGSIFSMTNADITLFAPAAGLVLTDFTEVDPNARIASYADAAVGTTLNTSETAYLYKDYTAGYIASDYTFKATLNITAFVSGSGQMLNVLSVVNTLGHANLTNDLHGIAITYVDDSNFTVKAREVSGGTEYLSTASGNIAVGMPIFLQLQRDVAVGTYGTLYVRVFSDPEYANQVGSTLSLTLHDNGTPDKVAFRYFNAFQTYNSGTSKSTSFSIGTVTANITAIPPNTMSIGAAIEPFTVAVTAYQAFASSIAATIDPFTVAVTAVKNSPVLQANFAMEPFAVSVDATLKYSATVNASIQDMLVSATAGILTITEYFSIRLRHKTTGAALTGKTTVQLVITQPSTGLLLDFADCQFRSSPAQPYKLMDEVSSVNQPGVYRCAVTTTLMDGWVEFEATYNDGSFTYSYPGEAYYTAGTRANGVWSTQQAGQITLLQNAVVNTGSVVDLVGKLHGLDPTNPLIVTPTTRTSGGISQSINTVGNTTTITRL